MKIHLAESAYELSAEYWKNYQAEVRKAYKEASELLPFGSKHINFFVQPREYDLIAETNDHASTHNSEFIELAFNPTKEGKDRATILDGVKHSVYHEMNHAARFNIPIYHTTFLDSCILEGLANVFTRDYAGEKALWADYPEDVTDWLQEIIVANDQFMWTHYRFSHPDGRRWIAYKVGTYIVDQAMKNSDKTIVELTQLECADILELAKIDIGNYHGLE
jgi:uncharacterized protein YjaZ